MAEEAIPGGTLGANNKIAPAPQVKAEEKAPEPPEQWREEFKKVVEQRDTFKDQYKTLNAEVAKLRAWQNEIAEKDKAMKERNPPPPRMSSER